MHCVQFCEPTTQVFVPDVRGCREAVAFRIVPSSMRPVVSSQRNDITLFGGDATRFCRNGLAVAYASGRMADQLPRRTIPELLSEALARRKLSERALSQYLGVSSNAVNAWRRGLRTPDPESCQRIASYLGLPLEDVLRAAGHPAPASEPTPDPPWLSSLVAEMRSIRLTPEEAEVLGVTLRGLLALRQEREHAAAQAPAAPGSGRARGRGPKGTGLR